MKTLALRRILLPSVGQLRLSAYFASWVIGFTLLAARALYAHATEAALALGGELSGLSDLTNDAETITLNGQRFHHASTLSDESVPRVLDRLEAHCRNNPALLAGAIGELGLSDPPAMRRHGPPPSLRRGVIREGNAERGMLICFTDQQPGTLDGLLEATQRFVASSDLTSFGKPLYSYAAKQRDGQTHVMSLWSDNGLDLSRSFPAAGDAAGDDSRMLPRPERARRLLSAAADGMPFGVRVYETRDPADGVQRFYDAWMKAHAWQLAGHSEDEHATAYLSPEGHQAFLSLSTADDRTFVTLTEAGRAERAPIAGSEVRR